MLNKHKRRDPWFLDDYSVNPYRSCEFGCVYCYIRGGGYGGGAERGLAAKVNAPTILKGELSRRAGRMEYGFIALSSATEPWMKLEQNYMLTRRCLEVIARYRFPVHCLTKSPLILRDLDLLREIDESARLPQDLRGLKHGVIITFSLSSLDEDIARIFEPGCPKPEERLEALQMVREEGFFAGLAYIPVLPFISDSDDSLEEMVKAAKEHRADYVFVGELTLPGAEMKIYYKVLERNFPELLPRYEQLFGAAGQPRMEYRRDLESRARRICRRYGIRYRIM